MGRLSPFRLRQQPARTGPSYATHTAVILLLSLNFRPPQRVSSSNPLETRFSNFLRQYGWRKLENLTAKRAYDSIQIESQQDGDSPGNSECVSLIDRPQF